MIHKLPTLAYTILDHLSNHSTMTQEEITELLDVEPKEVKYAVRRLQENNIIQQIPDLLDMRIVHYRLPNAEEIDQLQDTVSIELLEKLDDYLKVKSYQTDSVASVGNY